MASKKPIREFVYRGGGIIPQGVTHVKFAPGVIELVRFGRSRFRDCRRDCRHSLRVVVLNEGIQAIGDDAFDGCYLLESITFPSTVISIGARAFHGCRSLREVVLNEGIQTIGNNAFRDCLLLDCITFPSTIISIDEWAFSGCISLTDVVLNEGIQMIGDYAFDGCSLLESITFPSTLISIGDFAFKGCGNLRDVVLNEGIQRIGWGAFHNCSSLESFQFAGLSDRFFAIRDTITVERWEEVENKINAIPGMTMSEGGISISLVTIQNWKTSRGLLFHVLALISLSIDELKEATTISKLPNYIHNMASEIPMRKFVYTGGGIIPSGATHVKFAPGLREIGVDPRSSTFSDCRKSVKEREIDQSAFRDCRKSLRVVVLNEGIQTIREYALYRCSSLESITFPSTIISIGYGAFQGCRSLREVVLNEGIETIEYSAFHGCSSLESITFPSTVISIEPWAFKCCSNLREVVLNEGIKRIGYQAFLYCYALERFQFADLSGRFFAIRDTITAIHRGVIENKVNAIPGMAMTEDKISISCVTIQNWNTSKGPLNDILGLISYHELMREATTIVELALWKAKISNTDGSNAARELCRVEGGFPGPAKDALLQFLSYNGPR